MCCAAYACAGDASRIRTAGFERFFSSHPTVTRFGAAVCGAA
jgi:hypothetical protein